MLKRDRQWRRSVQEKKAAARMRDLDHRRERWRYATDANGRHISGLAWGTRGDRNRGLLAYIGTKAEWLMKTAGSDGRKRRVSNYSPNKSLKKKNCYHKGRSSKSPDTREFRTRELRKIMASYEINLCAI